MLDFNHQQYEFIKLFGLKISLKINQTNYVGRIELKITSVQAVNLREEKSYLDRSVDAKQAFIFAAGQVLSIKPDDDDDEEDDEMKMMMMMMMMMMMLLLLLLLINPLTPQRGMPTPHMSNFSPRHSRISCATRSPTATTKSCGGLKSEDCREHPVNIE